MVERHTGAGRYLCVFGRRRSNTKRMKFNWRKIALFLSGSFFCGAISHLILIVRNSPVTRYGFQLEAIGNWLLAGFDLVMTIAFYAAHRWIESRTKRA